MATTSANPLEQVLELLGQAYTGNDAWIWLYSRNVHLNSQRPIELLAAGKVETVVAEAERIAGEM